ncbi:MAG: metallophosphoesterase [Lachnospiraceae bacterium]|nr:metallophosphoesterase [Lachnospiraceae bacterium]
MKYIHLLTNKTTLFLISTLLIAIYMISGFYNPLITTKYSYTSSKVPESFDGFRITHISDFHCKEFGTQESDLIQAIRDTNPDIIVFTGDSIDDEHTIDNYSHLLEGIHDLAPIYYINGNHEYDEAAPLKESLELHQKYGVIDLNDKSVTLTRNQDSIMLTGLDFRKTMLNLRNDISYADTSHFNILLYHGTDKFDGIAPYNYDLVLSGHTHGGIVCLPFIGGIITNQKELFPKYDSGIFTVGHSTMISSRGLGDASVPRFHNPREVISITLHSSVSKSGS